MAIITLTTDFGNRDGYVAVIKGVILGIASRANLIDLSHDLPVWSIESAAWILANSYLYFPAESVHLAVVDPGVGSSRRAIAVRAQNQYFVGPDNGVFSMVLDKAERITAYELTERHWHLPNVSHTFHGRDVFAPVAAHLSNGAPIWKFGSAVPAEGLVRLPRPSLTNEGGKLCGVIVYIDHFGNLISNIDGASIKSSSTATVGNRDGIPVKQTYSEVARGNPVAFVGSHGFLEIAINCGSARETLEVDLGMPVRVNQ